MGHNICGHLLSALLCLDGVFASSGGQRCWMTKTTNIFSDEVETAFSCPQPGDPDHFTNCCGPSWQRKCCAPTKFSHGPIGGGSVISFFGIVTGVVILVVCLVLICCCCTPCCLLAKQRRRRGLVTTLLFLIIHIQSSGAASTPSIRCRTGAKHASYHSTTLSPSSATRLPQSASPLPWTTSKRPPSSAS